MNITYRLHNNILYIGLDGRVDAANAQEVEKQIFEIKDAHPNTHTVIDADALSYISSAGLRIILRLKKADSELAIINVAPEVYDVFDMTGFVEMVKIEKAYRKMSVEGCDFLAKGANGAVYRYNDETILKVYYGEDTLPEIEQERANARKAFVMGINTAIPYGIVRVGKEYGTVTELLNAVSVSKLIKNNPEDLETPANYYVGMIKQIHSTNAEGEGLPSNKEGFKKWLNFLKPHLLENQFNKLSALVEAIPETNTMLHGDYHTNNIMIQNGEAVLIDMDTLSVGHPIFELGYMYNAFIGYSAANPLNVLGFLGYPIEVSTKFWRLSLEKYFDTKDQAFLNSIEEKAILVGTVRALRHAIRHPEEELAEQKIAIYKQRIATLLEKVDTLTF